MNENTGNDGTLDNPPSRRNIIRSLGILSMVAAWAMMAGSRIRGRKNIIACAPDSRKKMIRMLTEDGQRVEIEESSIPASGKRGKISDRGLQNWIKK